MFIAGCHLSFALKYVITMLILLGGPPSDISDRSANSDKVAAGEKGSVVKKESTGKVSTLLLCIQISFTILPT